MENTTSIFMVKNKPNKKAGDNSNSCFYWFLLAILCDPEN
jgi:hypothetical protein